MTKDKILAVLKGLEAEHQIKVLFACEAGSRAWGFASPASDHDLRFVYVHQTSWYLSVQSRPEVIEAQVSAELELQGWDLRKALPLLRKSNPSILEWLHSGVVYTEHPTFKEVRALATRALQPHILCMAFRGTALSHRSRFLKGPQIVRKKYLHTVRAMANALWVCEHRTMPPASFEALIESMRTGHEIEPVVLSLLEAQRQGRGGETITAIPALADWLDAASAEVQAKAPEPSPPPAWEAFDEAFQTGLAVWET